MSDLNTEDLAVYLLVRTDMPSMNPGKALAQSHHAGFQLATKYFKNKLVQRYLQAGYDGNADGFNTTITLGAVEEDIGRRLKLVSKLGARAIFDFVYDPSYPFTVDKEIAHLINDSKKVSELPNGKVLFTRNEMTCAYALGDRNDPDFKSIFEGLDLHP